MAFTGLVISGGGVIGDPVKFCTFVFSPARRANFRYRQTRAMVFWGGVGWGAMTCTVLAHMFDATQLYLRTYSMLRNALAHMFDATQLYLRTCSMLRNCTCAHVRRKIRTTLSSSRFGRGRGWPRGFQTLAKQQNFQYEWWHKYAGQGLCRDGRSMRTHAPCAYARVVTSQAPWLGFSIWSWLAKPHVVSQGMASVG